MYDSNYQNELEHFGIKGMKWGVRRTPEQLGHWREKKQRTPEQRAKAQARMRKVIKAAKIGASVLAIASGTAAAGISLDAAFNSGAGLKAIQRGSSILSYSLANEGSKVLSSFGDALNMRDTGWSRVAPSQKAQKLTENIRYLGRQDETLKRFHQYASRFI